MDQCHPFMRVQIFVSALRYLLVLITAFLMLCLDASGQPSAELFTNAWVPDGPVESIVLTNGLAFVAGSFRILGPACGGLAGVDLTTGALTEPMPQVFGTASSIVSDGAGGFYLAGSFTRVGAHACTNIAHIKADHTVDTLFGSTFDDAVADLVVTEGRLFVAGGFTLVNGQPRSSLAELDPADGTLKPLALAINGPVGRMKAAGSRLYLGGAFTTVGQSNRINLAALQLGDGSVAPWRADCKSSSDYPAAVMALEVDGDRLLVGGYFNSIGGIRRECLAAVNLITGSVSSWNPLLSSQTGGFVVSKIYAGTGAVYLFGSFDAARGVARSYACAVSRTDASLLPWVGNFPYGEVRTVIQVADTLFLGGSFPSINSNSPPSLAALDAVSGAVRTWGANVTGPVSALISQGGTVYVSGDFGSIGGVVRANLAAIDLTTGRPTEWQPSIAGGSVGQLRLHGASLFLGGSFQSVNGTPRFGMAFVSLDTGELASTLSGEWSSAFGGVDAFLDSGAGRLFARRWDGTHAVIDTETSEVSTWDPIDVAGFSAAASNGKMLFVSGNFPGVGGVRRSMLAAFDLATRQLSSWAPSLDLPATRLYCFDRMVIATGPFTRANGEPRSGFAIFDAVTGVLSPLKVEADGGIMDLTCSANSFYLVGDFQHLNGALRPYYGAIDRLSGAVRSWSPPSPKVIESVVYPRGHIAINSENLVLAGLFSHLALDRHERMAVFRVTNAPPVVKLAGGEPQIDLTLPGNLEIPMVSTVPPGRIVRVDTLVDGNVVESTSGLPSLLTWHGVSRAGSYSLSAVAYDEMGEFAISSPAWISAHPPAGYVIPSIAMIAPTNGGVYAHDAPLSIDPGIIDPDLGVRSVTIALQTNRVFTPTSSPWGITLPPLAPGTYTLQVNLEDQYGIRVTNIVSAFRINRPPTNLLIADSTAVYVGTPIRMTTAASDKDGKIVRVEYFDNGVAVGSFTKSPYALLIPTTSPAVHTLQGVVIDDFGARATSAPVVVNVTMPPPPNDHFSNPTVLIGTAVEAAGDNRYATTGASDPVLPGVVPTKKTVWWTWVAPWSGRAFASTAGSEFDTVLAVHTGPNPPFFTKTLGVNGDEYLGTKSSRVEFDAVTGQTYELEVDGENGAVGAISIRVGPVIRITGINRASPSAVEIQAAVVPKISYRLESSSDLTNWLIVDIQKPESGLMKMSDTTATGNPARFYRIAVVP